MNQSEGKPEALWLANTLAQNVNNMRSGPGRRAVEDAIALLRSQQAEIERLRALLRAEAALLNAWARESREGGWSTHQVDPMRRRAAELHEALDRAADAGQAGEGAT